MSNREIKFRAWDKTKDKMSFVFTLQSIENSGLGEGAFIKQLDKGIIYLGWCEIMQYTGLKDKNAKDIYEGDICKDIFGGNINIGKITIEATRGVVVGSKPIWPHDVEVIGNIYETPNLIVV